MTIQGLQISHVIVDELLNEPMAPMGRAIVIDGSNISAAALIAALGMDGTCAAAPPAEPKPRRERLLTPQDMLALAKAEERRQLRQIRNLANARRP